KPPLTPPRPPLTPPKEGNKKRSPKEGNKNTPPKGANKKTPPSEANKETPIRRRIFPSFGGVRGGRLQVSEKVYYQN
ncbi:MAG: hypothetical protein LBC74_02555, partial [Planctomycetaceae bacterium]|nr:hypothetical protein [Planctomycetaceae bacterium]